MQRTTVLHMLPDFAVGGGQILLLRNLNNSSRERWRHIVCGLRGGPLAAAFASAGFETVDLGVASTRDWPKAFRRLVGLIRREEVAILHTNNTPGDRVFGQLAALTTGRPVVNTFHARPSPPEWPRGNLRQIPRFLIRHAIYFVNRLLIRTNVVEMIAVSDYVRQAHAAALGLSPERMTVIPPGVDMTIFERSRTEKDRRGLRRSLGLDTASPILICVGRIERSKGQRYWLPVLADILNDWPDACLMLVGDGPDEKLIGETAQELGIRHAVKMLGRRDDVPALLDISDIFVSASLTEGFGIAVLEAMAAGKPVVALHLPALSEFVQDGRTGFLVPVLSAEAFSEKLRAILSDPALQGKMEAAAKDAARHFTVQRSARQIEGVYQRVVERRTA